MIFKATIEGLRPLTSYGSVAIKSKIKLDLRYAKAISYESSELLLSRLSKNFRIISKAQNTSFIQRRSQRPLFSYSKLRSGHIMINGDVIRLNQRQRLMMQNHSILGLADDTTSKSS